MSWSLQNILKRIPLQRPITPLEHDQNWGKLETDFQKTQLEFRTRMPDPITIGGGSAFEFDVGLGHHSCVGMFYFGPLTSIPNGWTLADGVAVPAPDGNGGVTTFTPPDLRNLFIAAAGGTYAVGQTGGQDTVLDHNHGGSTQGTALTIAQIPDHTHNYTKVGGSGNQVDGLDVASLSFQLNSAATTSGIPGHVGAAAVHDHDINGGGAHDNRPAFKAYPIIVFIDANI